MIFGRLRPKKCQTEETEHGSIYLTAIETNRDQIPIRGTAYDRLWKGRVPDKGV